MKLSLNLNLKKVTYFFFKFNRFEVKKILIYVWFLNLGSAQSNEDQLHQKETEFNEALNDLQTKISPLENAILEAQNLYESLSSNLNEWTMSNQAIEASILEAQQINENLVKTRADLNVFNSQPENNNSKSVEIQNLTSKLVNLEAKLEISQQGKTFFSNFNAFFVEKIRWYFLN